MCVDNQGTYEVLYIDPSKDQYNDDNVFKKIVEPHDISKN